jgi:hypothetical protein
VLGWPFEPTGLREPTVSVNILDDVDEPEPAMLHNVGSVLESANAHITGASRSRFDRSAKWVTSPSPIRMLISTTLAAAMPCLTARNRSETPSPSSASSKTAVFRYIMIKYSILAGLPTEFITD